MSKLISVYIALLLALFILAQPTARGEVVDTVVSVDTVYRVDTLSDLDKVRLAEARIDAMKDDLEKQRSFGEQTLSTIETVASIVVMVVFALNIGGLLWLNTAQRRIIQMEFDAKLKELEKQSIGQFFNFKLDMYQYLSYSNKSMAGWTLLVQFFSTDSKSKPSIYLITNSFNSFVEAFGFLLQVQEPSEILRRFYMDCFVGVLQCTTLVSAGEMHQPHIKMFRDYLTLFKSYGWEKNSEIHGALSDVDAWLNESSLSNKSGSESAESDENPDNKSNIT